MYQRLERIYSKANMNYACSVYVGRNQGAEKTMKTINEYMAEQMSDSEFSRAYEEIQPEMNAIRATVEAGTSRNLNQKESSPNESV